MAIFTLIVGIILGLISGASYLQYRKLQEEISAISSTETSTVEDLKKISEEVAEGLGNTGYFRQQAEVKGTIQCENPLTANLSHESCIYYQTVINERYEKTEWVEDDEGNFEPNRSEGSNNLVNNVRCIDFFLEDDTGQILVNPDHGKIEGIQVYDYYQPADSIDELEMSFGDIEIEFSPRNDAEYQTLGYEFQEVILPVNIQVYIIGEASDRAGDLELHQPSEENQLFLISYKSEEELSEEKRGDIKKNKKIAQICFFSAIAFIVFALINLLN